MYLAYHATLFRQQQPLPLALLAHISLQSRLRVVAAIEEMLLQQQLPAPKLRAHDGWAIELYPPSHVMLETYARLLLTAPGTLVRKQVIARLRRWLRRSARERG